MPWANYFAISIISSDGLQRPDGHTHQAKKPQSFEDKQFELKNNRDNQDVQDKNK